MRSSTLFRKISLAVITGFAVVSIHANTDTTSVDLTVPETDNLYTRMVEMAEKDKKDSSSDFQYSPMLNLGGGTVANEFTGGTTKYSDAQDKGRFLRDSSGNIIVIDGYPLENDKRYTVKEDASGKVVGVEDSQKGFCYAPFAIETKPSTDFTMLHLSREQKDEQIQADKEKEKKDNDGKDALNLEGTDSIASGDEKKTVEPKPDIPDTTENDPETKKPGSDSKCRSAAAADKVIPDKTVSCISAYNDEVEKLGKTPEMTVSTECADDFIGPKRPGLSCNGHFAGDVTDPEAKKPETDEGTIWAYSDQSENDDEKKKEMEAAKRKKEEELKKAEAEKKKAEEEKKKAEKEKKKKDEKTAFEDKVDEEVKDGFNPNDDAGKIFPGDEKPKVDPETGQDETTGVGMDKIDNPGETGAGEVNLPTDDKKEEPEKKETVVQVDDKEETEEEKVDKGPGDSVIPKVGTTYYNGNAVDADGNPTDPDKEEVTKDDETLYKRFTDANPEVNDAEKKAKEKKPETPEVLEDETSDPLADSRTLIDETTVTEDEVKVQKEKGLVVLKVNEAGVKVIADTDGNLGDTSDPNNKDKARASVVDEVDNWSDDKIKQEFSLTDEELSKAKKDCQSVRESTGKEISLGQCLREDLTRFADFMRME